MNLSPEWCSWFAGLVDGEGCFTLKKNRGRWMLPELRILMRADDKPMMEEIRTTLGFGYVYGSRVRPDGKNSMCSFRVSHRRDLLALVRLFDVYPLRSRKRRDYEIWRVAVLLHQDRKNAVQVHVAELMEQIRAVRVYREDPR